jgi:hypothetical protein
MRLKLDKLEYILNSKKLIRKLLNTVKNEYRPYDPGNYIYNILLKNNNRFLTDENLELIYTTLISWNLNSRRAKLEDINIFKKSILNNKDIIKDLKMYEFRDLNTNFNEIFEKLQILYSNLKLNKNKTKLVTFSKTMHFLLPNLCIPIDRKYTLNFFYNNTYLNSKKEFEIYTQINKLFLKIYNTHDLSVYLENGMIIWNTTIPKILDNIVIGYFLDLEKSK